MSDRICLGLSPVIDQNREIYLSKHSWDCNWYWGLGYIGNSHLHTHVHSTFLHHSEYRHEWTNPAFWFTSTIFSQADWWLFLEYFQTAYTLKHAAEMYHTGGSNIASTKSISPNPEMAATLNKELELLLDKIWDWLKKLEQSNKRHVYDHPTRT